MSTLALTVALLLGVTEPPEITEIYPSPLPVGGTVFLTGQHFEDGETSVTLVSDLDPLATPVVQSLVLVLEDMVRFLVSIDTPLGGATLRVTNSVGFVEADVEIVPPPPELESVEPDPVVLGGLATLNGSALDAVDTVTLGGHPCEVTAQGAALIVCMTQASADSIGLEVPMTVSGPHGEDTLLVDTAPPEPVIDSLAPNPIRQGDLLTIQGALLPHLLSARVGGIEATLVSATDGELVVGVPVSVPSGATEVTVSIGTSTSDPAGPLWVDAADPDRPAVTAVYPSAVVVGGSAWAVGEHLDQITWTTDGLATEDCDDKSCRLLFTDAAPGPFAGALGGPDGTSVITGQFLEDDGQPAPTITEVEPSPAFVGETLTIHGEGLHEVTRVVVGGVVQPIDFLVTDQIQVTLSDQTSRGAERLFVTGTSGSNPLTVIVLDPLPSDDPPDAGSDASVESDAAEETDTSTAPQPGPEPTEDVDDSEDTEPTPAGGEAGPSTESRSDSGGGCQTGTDSPGLMALLGLMIAMVVTRRRRLV